jgi:hypothetical protein
MGVLLDGVMLLWFIQVLVAVVFVAVDIRRTPESPVMKWGFVIVTLYTGALGAFLYVLACREPFTGTHAQYVRPRWRQVVGSTMHCVAGDGIGILVAAAVFSSLGAPEWVSFIGEYVLGFLFGWTIFQSLFMRDMAGGSYRRSLRMTFLPEFVSMNGVMAGMVALSVPWRQSLGALGTPTHPEFWFVMSMSLTLGFVVTYPLNWWLVSAGLKHGMTTVAPRDSPHAGMGAEPETAMEMPGDTMADGPAAAMAMPTRGRSAQKTAMIFVSLAVLAAGLIVAGSLGSITLR